MELKIGDFGLATKLEFEGDRKRTVCGTPNYIAPEILDGKQGHSYEVDIWSLGVILYTLLIGKPPFETSDVKTTYKRIKANSYTFPEHIIISDAAKDLVTKILNLDPLKRPTLDQIAQHKFMTGHAIPKLLPASTLACPPSASYVKQYTAAPLPPTEKVRLESTAPLKNLASLTDEEKKKSLIDTMKPQPIKTPDPKTDSNSKKPGIVNSVWVKKWVDYSAKYGLGYLLSNGCFGVFFNDSSKIILNVNEQYFFEYSLSKKVILIILKEGHKISKTLCLVIILLNIQKNYRKKLLCFSISDLISMRKINRNRQNHPHKKVLQKYNNH